MNTNTKVMDNIQQAGEKLSQEADANLRKVQNRYEEKIQDLQRQYGYTRSKAEEELNRQLNYLNELNQDLQQRTQKLASTVDEKVVENRWQVLAGVFVAGLMVGLLVKLLGPSETHANS